MNIVKTENGFTLIEALTAMAVLSIGVFSLYSMQITSIKGNSKADRITMASVQTAELVERIIGIPADDVNSDTNVLDSNGDGTLDKPLQDENGDEDGGLDDMTTTDADYFVVSSDGHYTVYWNVAPDWPMTKVTSVRVHVIDNHNMLGNPVTFTYLKNGKM